MSGNVMAGWLINQKCLKKQPSPQVFRLSRKTQTPIPELDTNKWFIQHSFTKLFEWFNFKLNTLARRQRNGLATFHQPLQVIHCRYLAVKLATSHQSAPNNTTIFLISFSTLIPQVQWGKPGEEKQLSCCLQLHFASIDRNLTYWNSAVDGMRGKFDEKKIFYVRAHFRSQSWLPLFRLHLLKANASLNRGAVIQSGLVLKKNIYILEWLERPIYN